MISFLSPSVDSHFPGILCDRSTGLSARADRRFRIERLPELQLPGRDQPLAVYFPTRQARTHAAGFFVRCCTAVPVVVFEDQIEK